MGDVDNPFSAPAPSLAPPTPAPRSAMSTPQPPPAPPSHSSRSPAPPPPELTKLRTEHGTLSSSVSNLQTTGLDLENQTLEHNKEIMDLQAKLISLRSTFESENGNVEKLRKKANEQAEEMKTMSQDMIRAESELSGLRQEKDALDGQIMRDREDVREMKRRMVEIGEETIKMKAAVEKVKKEARQQKGLVTITKKQLSTSEGEREKTTRELEDVEKGVGLEDLQQPQASPFDSFTPASTSSASAFFSSSNPTLQTASHIPLPETPARILSPTASIKSNNPFDRFVTSPAPPPSSLPSSSPAARTEALSHEPAKPIKDLAEAVESGEAPTSPSTSRDVNGEEHSTTHVLPEPIEHVKDLAVEGITAAGMALAGVGAAIFGGGETEVEKEEKREGEQEKAMEEGVAEGVSGTGPGGKDASFGAFDDSFGGDMPSSDASNAPVAGQVDDAGFPVAASSTAQADFGGFDDGFDDGFEPVGAAPSQADGPGARAPEGVRSPSEIPFDEGAGAFDSSFGQQEFVPVATFESTSISNLCQSRQSSR
jgi:epidermal growth factor receptor substrate 15